jgi:hypothetical protein
MTCPEMKENAIMDRWTVYKTIWPDAPDKEPEFTIFSARFLKSSYVTGGSTIGALLPPGGYKYDTEIEASTEDEVLTKAKDLPMESWDWSGENWIPEEEVFPNRDSR